MLSGARCPGPAAARRARGSGSYSGSCGCRRCAPPRAVCCPGRCAAAAGTPRGRSAARSAGTRRVRAPEPGPARPGLAPRCPELTCSIQALNSCSSAGENGPVSGTATALPRWRAGPGPNRAEPRRAKPPPALPVPPYLRPRAPRRRRRRPAARPRSAARASPWPNRAGPSRDGRDAAGPNCAEPSRARPNGAEMCRAAARGRDKGRGRWWAWHRAWHRLWAGHWVGHQHWAWPAARRVRRYPARKTITNPGSP